MRSSPDVQAKVRKIVNDNMPLITEAMTDEEEVLTKKFAEGGMTITEEDPKDIDAGLKTISAYWQDWAKSRGRMPWLLLRTYAPHSVDNHHDPNS